MNAVTSIVGKGSVGRGVPEAWMAALREQRIATPLGHLNVRTGGRADGPAMVFWPSVLINGSMWRFQVEHYAPTHRIVLVDAPGIGKSDPLRRRIDLEACSQCLVAVLDALEIDKCVLVGSSWGALLASVFPALYPQRVSAAVAACGTARPPTTSETVQMTVLSNVLGLYATAPGWLVKATQSAFAGKTAKKEKPEFMDYLRCVLGEDPKSVSYAMKGIVLGRTDRRALLRTIRDVPVLVLAGAEDGQFSVEQGRELANAIPGGRFAVLDDTGHLAPRESPALVNAAIDAFLGEVAG